MRPILKHTVSWSPDSVHKVTFGVAFEGGCYQTKTVSVELTIGEDPLVTSSKLRELANNIEELISDDFVGEDS